MPRFDKSASDMQTFIDKRAIGQGAVNVAGHKRALSEQQWRSLVRHREDGQVLVLHEPNAASGGRPSRLEVGDFLVRDARGPQHAELLRLAGSLVDQTDEDGVADSRPLRVVLEGDNFKALVNGEVAECVAVTGEIVQMMLSDVGFAMMEDTIRRARLRAEDVSDEAPI
jgi:hypothetical protein